MTWFCTLRQFQFNHFNLIKDRAFGEAFRAESAVIIARTEVAGSQLPNQIAAVFAVIAGDRTFAGVVVKLTEACTFV